MNKLNIAIFSDNFLPGVGGTENAVFNLANELTNKGHSVLVICPHYNKKHETNNYPFAIYRKCSIKIDKNDYFALPSFNKDLKNTLKKFQPDIIHCNTQASMLSLALKTAKMFNIPCISTIHTKFSFAYKNAAKLDIIVKPLLKSIGKKLKKADRVTAVSYDMKREFALYGYNEKFDVIKNGATFTKLEDDNLKEIAKQKFDLQENLLLFVGHISKIKNLQFIFESLDILYQTYKDFQMVFVGAGDGDKYFRQLASSKPYANQILFTGSIVDKTLLQSIYANAKLYLFPSIFDNDGLTIIEAATYGVPSITLESTGSSERITNEQNGFVVSNNPQKMAEKIEYLLTNPEILQAVGKKASKELPKSWSQVIDEYVKIYYDTINEKSIKKIS